MAQPFRLQVLLDLARDRLEAASVELQRLRQQWGEAQTKLDQLSGYQTEYAGALQERLSAGIAAHLLSDYRLFLDKLARAIRAQGDEVERRRIAWEQAHVRWLSLRQREQALEVLLQRHRAMQALHESRREQKQQDEFALKSAKENPVQR
jgi:flagellar FliJ protein